MTDEMVFDNVSYMIKRLCEKYSIQEPEIHHALDTDPCDVTDYRLIRLNVAKADYGEWNLLTLQYYGFHVFAHYICDMHSTAGDSEADHIANVIASRFMEKGYL